jgi:hypothetical protein
MVILMTDDMPNGHHYQTVKRYLHLSAPQHPTLPTEHIKLPQVKL